MMTVTACCWTTAKKPNVCSSFPGRYFRNAVLPAEKELYADIFKQRTYHCAECGTAFVPNSNRQKYCLSCSKKVHRRQKNESARKRKADN